MKPVTVAFALALTSCTRAAPPEPAPVSLPPATPAAPPSSPTAVLEPGAWRAPAEPTPTTQGAPPQRPPAPPPATVRVRVVRTADAEGEDGAGSTVAARWPVAIELESADGWPAGALTTTLFVGAMHFHNAGHPTLTTARYVVADGRALPADAEVALQYGGNARRVVAPSLMVPR